IFTADMEACVSGSPYLEGYIMEESGAVQGYAMVAKSFSTEFGKPCIWIEDVFVKSEYRDLGIGSRFLRYIEEQYPNAVFRLEVEAENEMAVHVYKKAGYEFLPSMEMKK
ncbi:MAG: GNAT family N-acetyltransferase, partial [Clostridia bacterium]|nr:GNAT family N-acetyltransferase [Clostridia bacterium]